MKQTRYIFLVFLMVLALPGFVKVQTEALELESVEVLTPEVEMETETETIMETIQDLELGYNIVPPSPESSQIHRFDFYPVNLFTGAADINVPIYSFEIDGIKIPIELKYQASGIKLEDESGSVGLGWSLIAGGRISRTIRGSADEWGLFEAREEDNIKLLNHLVTPFSVLENYYNYFYLLEQRTRDAEQDMFYYSTPTINGRFILNETSRQIFNCTTIPFRPILFDYGVENNTPNFTYFEITDENGNYYRFGKSITNPSNTNREMSTALSVPTSWLLSEIISADKSDTIRFHYKTRNTILPLWYGRWFPNDYIRTIDYGYNNGGVTSTSYLGFSSGYDLEQAHSSSRIDYSRLMLNRIEFKNGKVEFISDANSVMIDSILVYNKIDDMFIKIKEVSFNYNTFVNQEHYTLDEVIFNDKNSDDVYSYSFDYNNENEAFPSVSQTKGIDWWGYYNGYVSNTYLYPSTDFYLQTHNGSPVNLSFSGGNRTANDNAKHSILTDIFLPTGGRTHFEYEGNFYSGYLYTRGGGLRIKSIELNDENDVLTHVKKYKYGENESGYGESLIEPYPEYYKTETTSFYLDKGPYYSDNYSYRQIFIGSSPTVNLSYSQQPSVVYPYVMEYIENGQGEELSKTEYIFSFNEEGLVQEDIIRPLLNNPFLHSYYKAEIRDWGQEGNLLEKTVYKKTNEIYLPVQKTKLYYETLNIAEYHNLVVRPYGQWETENERLDFNLHYINTSSFGGKSDAYRQFCKFAWEFGDQELITGATRLASKEIYDYNLTGNITVTNKIKYKYNNSDHLFPSEITNYKSEGDSVLTNYYYPQDRPLGISTSTAVLDTMVLRNIIAPVLKQEDKLNGTKLIAGIIKNYTLDNNIVVPSDIEIAKTDGLYETRILYDDYDNNGNLIQAHKLDDINTAYLWDSTGTYLMAKVENAAYSQVGTQDGKVCTYDSKALHTSLNSLVSGAMITTFSYKPLLGLTSQTGPDGRTVFYEYDDFGRLEFTRDPQGNIVNKYRYHYANQ